MKDEKLIDLIARIWVANGGDADGIDWAWKKIRDRIAKLSEEERDESNKK